MASPSSPASAAGTRFRFATESSPWVLLPALDVGRGNGLMMAALEGSGLAMSGIDMHWSALARARARVHGPLFCSTATALPFLPDFDLVTLLDVIEHVDDDVGVLDEARRVLAPGGHAIVTVRAGPALWSTYDELIGHNAPVRPPGPRCGAPARAFRCALRQLLQLPADSRRGGPAVDRPLRTPVRWMGGTSSAVRSVCRRRR